MADSQKVFAGGTGSILYNTADDGKTWSKLVDLNEFLETPEEVQGISAGYLTETGNILMGTNNGLVFVKDVMGNQAVQLLRPHIQG
jgi:photosystem II stability/assembly factor-like uncharacterized protein